MAEDTWEAQEVALLHPNEDGTTSILVSKATVHYLVDRVVGRVLMYTLAGAVVALALTEI